MAKPSSTDRRRDDRHGHRVPVSPAKPCLREQIWEAIPDNVKVGTLDAQLLSGPPYQYQTES